MTRDTAELTDDVLDDIPLAKSETPEELEDLALGEDYALNPEYVEMVIDAADSGDAKRLRELVGALEPADVADLMGFLTADYREQVIPLLDPEALGEIISEMDENLREEVLEATPSVTLARALEELDTDDAADVIDDLDDTKRFQVLAAMGEIDRAAIETTLSYEDETAGRLMQREFLAAPEFWTVGQTIDHVREAGETLPELFFDVYVVDPTFKPVGAIPISILLRSRRDTPLTELMEAVTEIPVEMDQEEVAYIFDKYHLISAPVIEPGGRLVGQITVDDIVEVIRDEAEEDILALAGVSDAGRDASVVEIVRSRLPWLMLNLATATVAVSGVAIFQAEIAQLVALAILMPIVSSLGGNAGTQTLAVAVRALASKELTTANARRIVLRELLVGLVNGLCLALVMGTATYLFFGPADHHGKLAIIVGSALVANIFTAAVGGILAPLALEKMGRDPAVSSSIFVTFLTDFTGFFAVLLIASLLLH
ncbi:magnesium transporter [Caulobacter sp. RL271]|jgi:magnesium transporter|uniref:Magnesium transporter MgtE n=1 Tax=Caulobacter segnis TaxID=88688 RepID=A0ABY4ZNV7_9CAUL|nr:magnesium transporter [Caulobacter segnis]USQ94294.1 magnesium transporter [Caulobacter segnis]